MKHLLIVGLLVWAVACGGSSPAPAPSPTPTPVTPPAPPITVRLSGRVTATNGGQPLAGLGVALGSVSSTTDGSGAYTLTLAPGAAGALLVTGLGIVPRTVRVAVSTPHDLALDVFGAGFDLAFYRQFARNGFDAPEQLQPIRRWSQAPKIYLRTVDEAGVPIDAATLDVTAAALINTAGTWSGGVFGLAALERGTESREGVAGWLTVKWPNPPDTGCGRAQVGTNGGWIAMNYLGVGCGCPGTRIYPRAVRHELGHAFGYWHTDRLSDVMYGSTTDTCDLEPSAREREYARYVYRRPIGNTDPDVDPSSAVQSFATHTFRD